MKNARAAAELTQEEARLYLNDAGIEISAKSFTNWETGKHKPRGKKAQRIIDLLESYPQHSGDGAREPTAGYETETPAPTGQAEASDETVSYALVEAGAGPSRDASSDGPQLPASPEQIRSAVGYVPAPEHAFWCRIAGDSMAPWLSNGEIVLAQECQSVEVAGRYVYWLDDHEGHQVKHFEPLGEGDLRITQYGPTPRTEEYEHEEGNCWRDSDGRAWRFRICGRVIYPADTGRSLLETTTRQLKDMLREQAAGYASKDE